MSGVTGSGTIRDTARARRIQLRESGVSLSRPSRSSVGSSQALIVETTSSSLEAIAARAFVERRGSSSIHQSQAWVCLEHGRARSASQLSPVEKSSS